MDDGHKTYTLDGLEEKYDENLAKSILELSIDEMVSSEDIAKGIDGANVYQFDLETPDGIKKTLELLPVLSSEVLNDIMIEIWPGASDESPDELKRAEILGFLLDYAHEEGLFVERLDAAGSVDAQEAPEGAAVDPNATQQVGIDQA